MLCIAIVLANSRGLREIRLLSMLIIVTCGIVRSLHVYFCGKGAPGLEML